LRERKAFLFVVDPNLEGFCATASIANQKNIWAIYELCEGSKTEARSTCQAITVQIHHSVTVWI
jgi:hypothetical protein